MILITFFDNQSTRFACDRTVIHIWTIYNTEKIRNKFFNRLDTTNVVQRMRSFLKHERREKKIEERVSNSRECCKRAHGAVCWCFLILQQILLSLMFIIKQLYVFCSPTFKKKLIVFSQSIFKFQSLWVVSNAC